MQLKPFQLKFSVIIFALTLIFGFHRPLSAQQETIPSLDLIIKINQLENVLDLIDNLAGADSVTPAQSPTAMLRGMLPGMSWVDASRAIAVGINFNNVQPESKPSGAVLIPFKQPNVNFQSTFNPITGADYYIVPLPPGNGKIIDDAVKDALVTVSDSKTEYLFSIQAAVNKLLNKSEPQFLKMLSRLDNLPENKIKKDFDLTHQEIKNMLDKLYDTACELDLFTIGIDSTDTALSVFLEAKASGGTDLAQIFTKTNKTTLLGNYKPQRQINFRSHSYNFNNMLKLINDCFGQVYAKLGVDFTQITTISENFTGEIAGGVSFDQENLFLETISVLKESENNYNFIETIYLPWLIEYGKNIAGVMGKESLEKAGRVVVRTNDSNVAGHKVVGVKFRLLYSQFIKEIPQNILKKGLMLEYELRMTTVGNLFIIAPNDNRIGELVNLSTTFKEEPATEEALMVFDINMADYLKGIAHMMNVAPGDKELLSDMGKMTCVFDLQEGAARVSTSIKIDAVNDIIAFSKKIAAADFSNIRDKKPDGKPGIKNDSSVVTKKDALYWINKGSLSATYGNDIRAIEYFEKAVELDPLKSEAYFQMGISYGELGKYQKAISSINKSLALENKKGLYYYGRGRVYLLSDKKDNAIKDFKHAATLGNRDAQYYLENTANDS